MNLKTVELNEGLVSLGQLEEVSGEKLNGFVFCGSALEEVHLPSTLKVLEISTFAECKHLERVMFSEGLKEIRSAAFC